MKVRKDLKDLNLMDRFLFSEAMEDPENMRTLLEIILGREIVLKYLPQAEKEQKTSPKYRFAKLDVWAADTGDNVYDTEVQGENTGNLRKRSRYYQSMIDVKLLPPGETDFNKMENVYIILIMPFDLFGKDKYRYTFQMSCKETEGVVLGDGATRIFLNSHGKNPDEVSPELVELLKYIEHSNAATASACSSPRIKSLHNRIETLKSSEEVSIRYMQRWEELAFEREEGRKEGREEGRKEGRKEGVEEGDTNRLKSQIRRKLEKNKSVEVIAEELEEDNLDIIRKLVSEIDEEDKEADCVKKY